MCEVCHNITGINCPVCTPTDRSEVEKEQVSIKVTHCSNCPMGEYWDSTNMEGYNCHADPENIRTVILVTIEDRLADDMPLPDECPLRTKVISISL